MFRILSYKRTASKSAGKLSLFRFRGYKARKGFSPLATKGDLAYLENGYNLIKCCNIDFGKQSVIQTNPEFSSKHRPFS